MIEPAFQRNCQIPLLANSYFGQQYDFTAKVQYIQIPRQPIYCQNPLLAHSIALIT